MNNPAPGSEPLSPHYNPSAHPSASGSHSSSRHHSSAGIPTQQPTETPPRQPGITDTGFDIVAWYPAYQSCQRFFVNHAQHDGMVQAVAAFCNIRLPFQFKSGPLTSIPTGSPFGGFGVSPNFASDPQHYSSTPSLSNVPLHAGSSLGGSSGHYPSTNPYGQRQVLTNPPSQYISLIPFVRRLVCTNFDTENILHGFFGNDWRGGVGPLHESERRNYLFTAKSVGWAKAKWHYDGGYDDESVPFLKPLRNPSEGELTSADKSWSDWLLMEDWSVGPRHPEVEEQQQQQQQREEEAAMKMEEADLGHLEVPGNGQGHVQQNPQHEHLYRSSSIGGPASLHLQGDLGSGRSTPRVREPHNDSMQL
jgi:hypothetical protein